MLNDNMSKIIFETRAKLNLSQEDFGKLLGVTRVAVCRWEKDLSYPTACHYNMIKCFSEIKKPPKKHEIKNAMVKDGPPLALYLVLKSRYG